MTCGVWRDDVLLLYFLSPSLFPLASSCVHSLSLFGLHTSQLFLETFIIYESILTHSTCHSEISASSVIPINSLLSLFIPKSLYICWLRFASMFQVFTYLAPSAGGFFRVIIISFFVLIVIINLVYRLPLWLRDTQAVGRYFIQPHTTRVFDLVSFSIIKNRHLSFPTTSSLSSSRFSPSYFSCPTITFSFIIF